MASQYTNRNLEQQLHAPFGLLKGALQQKLIIFIQFKGMHGLGTSRLLYHLAERASEQYLKSVKIKDFNPRNTLKRHWKMLLEELRLF